MIKKILLLTALIAFLITLPTSSTLAQNTSSSAIPQSGNDGIIDSLSSAISQLIAQDREVRFDNPQNYFPPEKSPQFTLIAPNADTIQAKIIRKSINQEIPLKIDKQADGKFLITFADPYIILDQYSLDVIAKESFFYNRHIVLDFKWGNLKPEESAQTSWLKSFLEARPEYKNMPIVKKNASSVHFKRPDGKIEANFTGNPINYQDSQGNWQPIDTTLKDIGNGEFSGSGIPTIVKPDGTVKVKDSTHSQKTTRFGYFDPATKQFISLQELPAGTIQNNQYIRETKEYKHVLTLLDTGLKEELTLFSPPASNVNIPNSYLVLETEVTGINLPDGWVNQFSIDNSNFPLPTTKDATGKEIETKRYAVKLGGKQYIYTGIPVNTLTTSSYPLTIDPDFAGSTADGGINGDNSSYATSRSTSVVYNTTDVTLRVGQSQYFQLVEKYRIYRGFVSFNTSSIGTESTVTQANLKLVCTTDYSTTDFDINIIKHDWLGDWATNLEADYDGALSHAEDNSIWRNTSGMSVNTQYTSGNLDTGWIDKVSTTKYSLVSNRDYDGSGSVPSDAQNLLIASADNATPAYRPVLTVLYEDASPTPTPTPTPTPAPGVKFSGVKMSGVCVGKTACPTNTPSPVYIQTQIGCDFPSGQTPNQICQSQGYSNATTDGTGYAASGYYWKECSGASVSSCNGLSCTIDQYDCTGEPGSWSTQIPYPDGYQVWGSPTTNYVPSAHQACDGYNPGWTIQVYCLP